VYTILQLEIGDSGKLGAELSPTVGSLAAVARRLIVRDRIIDIKFLVDRGADVSIIPITRQDRTQLSDRVL